MNINLQQIAQIAEIIGSVIAIDGIIKQVALKQGNTKLVSICDLIATDLNELLVLIQAILSSFSKPSSPSGINSPSGVSPLSNTEIKP